eukprot:g31193.t1
MEQCAIACGPVLRLALQPFAVPLLRLAAARPRLSAASSAARRAVQQLMGSWGGLRMVWRAWMQAICVGSRATTDQSLLAESLRLASESLHICGSGAELRRQVLQEIFSVAIDALSDQAYQIRDAAKQFFRAAEHALGTEQLQEEILDVAPSRLKLAMEALEHPGPQLAHASCAGGPRNGGQRKLRRPIRAAAILPARSTSTSVRDLEAAIFLLKPICYGSLELRLTCGGRSFMGQLCSCDVQEDAERITPTDFGWEEDDNEDDVFKGDDFNQEDITESYPISLGFRPGFGQVL